MKPSHIKYILPFLLSVAGNGSVFSQSIRPGNVGGLCSWLVTQRDGSGQGYWEEKIARQAPEVSRISGRSGNINGHPALYFDGDNNEYVCRFDLNALSRFTCMAVCRSEDAGSEQSIWSIESGDRPQLVMTTGRMADLTEYNYLNFDGKTRGNYPGIVTCVRYKPAEGNVSGDQRLRIGHKPRREKLPLESFRGLIAEMLIYDRVLSPEERLRVETYLCIKYGLSLEQATPASYINSRREVIWDADAHRGYGARMTALGRDDASGLHQRSSESSLALGLLRLSLPAAQESLADNSFLLCSDNGGSLKMIKKQGEPLTLERKWKILSHGDLSSQTARLEIVPAYIEDLPSPGNVYRLMRDRSGSGLFPVAETDYLPTSGTASSGFDALRWDVGDAASQEVFTLIEAPAFFVRAQVQEPGCKNATTGRLDVALVGGQAPCQIRLLDEKMQLLRQQTTQAKYCTFDQIEAGHYFLLASDLSGMTCTEELYVNHADGPLPEVNDRYTLPAGSAITVVAGASGTDRRYSWNGPGGFKAYAPQAEIRQAGNYIVSVEDAAGCRTSKTFTVQPSLPHNFQSVALLPNPTKDGNFALRIKLFRSAPVRISIYDLQGTLLRRETLAESSIYHLYRGNVRNRGLYLIELSSEGSTEVRKLIYL
ncbi:MAG: T9SS type A sorting domain-containing protein [Tannerella sp.]|jgi:hypothetical protein|nr:T9SS type A sorting domain-containing protein [Tannerella sp.]